MKVSLKVYALTLSLIILLISIIFGHYIYLQIQNAQIKLSQWKQNTAQEELIKAIESARKYTINVATDFAEWDEVRQQIINPVFYPYWRDQRMMSSQKLPNETISANLYTSDGDSLSSLNILNFPSSLESRNIPEPYVINDKSNGPLIISFAPVISPGGQSVIGYVAVSYPYMPLLVNHPYQHLKEDSINFSLQLSKTSLPESKDYIVYELDEDESSAVVKSILNIIGIAVLTASLIIAILLYVLLNYGVQKPLQLLIRHINMLRKNPDFLNSGQFIKQLHIHELNDVALALNAYQEELNNMYGNLDKKNQELRSLAYTDTLTGIKNRRAFNQHWDQIISIAGSTRMSVCMMLFDVNHFKVINDSYGHSIGDALLIELSSIISDELRKGDHLYRLGGDEFGTAIINCNQNAAFDIANRCLKRISDTSFISIGIMEKIRVSIGIACADSASMNELDNLGWQADAAMYLAKRPNNDNVMIYESNASSISPSLFSNHIYSAVFDAIETGQGLTIFYQPIINLEDGNVSYYESLVRIWHKDELITPGQIFPIIAARQLEIDLDKAVVEAIIQDFQNKRIPDKTGISINLSGPSVGCTELISWIEPLIRFLKNYKIVFEVTETSLISQMSRATDNLNKLKSLGFQVALDDFGSGYSSLGYLGSMPVDIVKFDISLISELNNQNKRKLIFNLCNMIKEIGYEMVAEGIENTETHQQIILAGFNYGQGYLYGKPDQTNFIKKFEGVANKLEP